MKTKGKAWQLVVTVLLIAAFVYTAFFGVAVSTVMIKTLEMATSLGVDKGAVNVMFGPRQP